MFFFNFTLKYTKDPEKYAFKFLFIYYPFCMEEGSPECQVTLVAVRGQLCGSGTGPLLLLSGFGGLNSRLSGSWASALAHYAISKALEYAYLFIF